MGLTDTDRAAAAPAGRAEAGDSKSHCHDIVVIGASAGGVEALSDLVERLPAGLPAAVFVVLHLSSGGPSLLPAILNRAGALPAASPVDGDAIEHGQVYVAPPDAHLLVAPDQVRLWRGPPEHASRPAIDPLFRTAAGSYGSRVAGVMLSGTLDDGVAGLAAVKRHGGKGIVQSPDEAQFPAMPTAAIATLDVDFVLPIRQLASKLADLARTPAADSAERFAPTSPPEIEGLDVDTAMPDIRTTGLDVLCPECGQPLVELLENEAEPEFACAQGHAFSGKGLIARQGDELESALWETVRKLEQRAILLAELAGRARAVGAPKSAERFEEQARDNMVRVRFVRRAVLASAVEDIGGGPTPDEQEQT